MTRTAHINPFHAGERAAQKRAGVGDVARWASGFVRDYMPEQHREFHTSLPFLIIAGGDSAGRTWVTLIEGDDGFIRSPDPRRLTLQTVLGRDDPLAPRLAEGGDIGAIGIELATRRRNRFSGYIRPEAGGYIIDMRQTFGNCPQYIHERAWTRVPRSTTPVAAHAQRLSAAQIARIQQADTLFIGSGHQGEAGAASNGYDASHRGGAAGFVQVIGPTRLQIPDYSGNNFFNTIGNILSNPNVGLLFVDFETGGLLHISGRAQIDWSPENAHDPDARRLITVEIDRVIDRPGALSLRWEKLDHQTRKLRLVRREAEAAAITSFYFAPVDGRPLDPFLPGQHLPVSMQIPGQASALRRSYSLSGAASDLRHYRLSIKREEHGLVSRYLHDHLREGDEIEARPPAGDFTIPQGDQSVVAISAGVGLTPMLPMLHELAEGQRPAWHVHGTRNSRNHALRNEVDTLIAQNAHLRQRVFYSKPEAGDVAGRDYDVMGRVTAEDVIALGAGADAHYMLCGPSRFLADLDAGLRAVGVPAEHIHVEIFGPDAQAAQ